MSESILTARNLSKVVPSAEGELTILHDLSLDLARGASEPQVFQARVPVPATRGAREEVATKV